jgi:hypothetical protein
MSLSRAKLASFLAQTRYTAPVGDALTITHSLFSRSSKAIPISLNMLLLLICKNMLLLLQKICGISVDVLLLGFISSLPQLAWEEGFDVVVVDVLLC